MSAAVGPDDDVLDEETDEENADNEVDDADLGEPEVVETVDVEFSPKRKKKSKGLAKRDVGLLHEGRPAVPAADAR